MVALKGAQISNFLTKPDPSIRAVLIYGPDHGLVKERVDRLITDFVGAKEDPFNVSILDDGALKDDPQRLGDEAHAQSLMGGNRAVLIHDAGDGLFNSIPPYLKNANTDCLIIARAGDLKPNSKLRGFFQKTEGVVSLPCYTGDSRSISVLINEISTRHDLEITPDARRELLNILGSDFAVSKSEIEKLCLYCLKAGKITLKDVEQVCGDNGLITLDGLSDSLLTGDLKMFDRAFSKASSAGQPPSAIILSVSRHLQTLHNICLNIEQGLNIGDAIQKISPPIHFKRKDSFMQQARLWQSADIVDALCDLQICERETRLKPGLSSAIAHRSLLKMGYIARSKQQRR